jgi:hypothetical protein
MFEEGVRGGAGEPGYLSGKGFSGKRLRACKKEWSKESPRES